MRLPATTRCIAVLCVGESSLDIGTDLEAKVNAAGGVVEYCKDVYRATVKVCRNLPTVLIVSVDAMPQEEMEFFWIIRRRHKNLPILVAGNPHSSGRLEQAIESGATAEYSAQAIDDYIGLSAVDTESQHRFDLAEVSDTRCVAERREETSSQPVTESCSLDDDDQEELDRALCQELADAWGTDRTSCKESSPPDKTAQDKPGNSDESEVDKQPQANCSDNERSLEVTTEPGKNLRQDGSDKVQRENKSDESKDGRTPKGKARVPWLTYSDGPKRTGPVRSSPPSSEPTDTGATEAPLLSPEELEALLGDDGETGKK